MCSLIKNIPLPAANTFDLFCKHKKYTYRKGQLSEYPKH